MSVGVCRRTSLPCVLKWSLAKSSEKCPENEKRDFGGDVVGEERERENYSFPPFSLIAGGKSSGRNKRNRAIINSQEDYPVCSRARTSGIMVITLYQSAPLASIILILLR